MTQETSQIFSIENLTESLLRMKAFIDSQDHHNWTEFNQAKKIFLEQFKIIPQDVNKHPLWKEFTEYADSGRNIRKLQEEEGEYAAAMILQALDALELEVGNLQANKASLYFPLFEKVEAFKTYKQEMLQDLYKFKFLTTKGHQLQSLREELAKTGMRLSIKGKLFDRLSKLGDKVFPVKKDAAQNLLVLFRQALETFCKASEKEQDGAELLFQIRLIQGFLKELTLKKADYDAIKLKLDPLWKKGMLLKDKKEQEMNEVRLRSNQVKEGLNESFIQLRAHLENENDAEALKLYEMMCDKMRDRALLKNDYRELKDQLETLCRPIFDRKKAKIEERDLLLKQKQEAIKGEKEALFEAFEKCTTLEDKKTHYEKILEMPLDLEELYHVKLRFYRSTSEMIYDLFELEKVYFEFREIQKLLRADMFASSLDFSLSMALSELYDQMRELSSQILQRLD